MNNIDWTLIGKAIQYYTDNKYNYKEVPWMVQKEAINTTIPTGKLPFFITHPNMPVTKMLVGSAEQSFIQTMLDGNLSKGKYCAATPCFRDDIIDKWHQLYFFKVELIEVEPDFKSVFEMMYCAKTFMEELGNCKIDIIKTNEGYDLKLQGIEVGSYGYRKTNDFSWIYGTGLALPRFSQALNNNKNS